MATGACWTYLREVREYAEEKLRINGVDVVEENITNANQKQYELLIEVVASRLLKDGSGNCTGYVRVSLRGFTMVNGALHLAALGSLSYSLQRNKFNRDDLIILEKIFSDFAK